VFARIKDVFCSDIDVGTQDYVEEVSSSLLYYSYA